MKKKNGRPNTLGKRGVTSLDPGDMKVGSNDNLGMNTGLRAPMPKPRRPLFKQAYWNGSKQHADNLHGNQSGKPPVA